ncbi:MAG: hypothetical protein IT379_38045 [Deltaproteobacteria bacterium]|nr:hypothetical protein [Deltaproteobacteria bacterium]
MGDLALLDRLSDAGFSASIATTYNVYLPFYEQLVLRRLRAAGCQHNVLLVDASQLAASIADEHQRPRLAGIDYTLVPVSAGGAFHPKVLLRLGKRKGSLYVGSHNLTLAGTGHNHELTTAVRYDGTGSREAVVHFREVIAELRGYLETSLPGVREAFEAAVRTAPWLSGPAPVSPDTVVVGSHRDVATLWTRVRKLVRGAARRVLVVGPFFDEELSLLRAIARDLLPTEGIFVAIDPETVSIDPTVAAAAPFRFVDASGQLPRERRRDGERGYLHAKALWFQTDEGELLVLGSANPTAAAFLLDLANRNAEIVVARWSEATTTELLGEAGLGPLLEAPPVTETQWAALHARNDADGESGDAPATDRAGVLLAETVEDGFLVGGVIADRVVALDDDGTELETLQPDPPADSKTHVPASAETRDRARWLRSTTDQGSVVLVHHTTRVAELYVSSARRELRAALGRLDEDPSQLETLLQLTEKAIFDSGDITRPAVRGDHGSPDGVTATPVSEASSLAIDAQGRPSARRKRRQIASGDLAVLLDALIHRLGQGLLSVATGDEGRSEEELVGSDDDEPPIATPPLDLDLSALAEKCRRKVKLLVKRMLAQLDKAKAAPDDAEPSRRAVVQLAAVLAIIRALRAYERRSEWRRAGLRLLDDKALVQLFDSANASLVPPEDGILARALVANYDEPFEEHHLVIGLLVWLAWETGIDLEHPLSATLSVELDADPWPPLQWLLFLAPWIDDHVTRTIEDAVRATPRRGHDPERWLRAHLPWLQFVASIERSPDPSATLGGRFARGDLVCLAASQRPRVRLVLRVDDGTQGAKLQLMRPDGTLMWMLASRVARVPTEPNVHAAVGAR